MGFMEFTSNILYSLIDLGFGLEWRLDYLVLGIFGFILASLLVSYLLNVVKYGVRDVPIPAKESRKSSLQSAFYFLLIVVLYTALSSNFGVIKVDAFEEVKNVNFNSSVANYDCGFSIKSLATLCGWREGFATDGEIITETSTNIYTEWTINALMLIGLAFLIGSIGIKIYWMIEIVLFAILYKQYLGNKLDVLLKEKLDFKKNFIMYLFFLPWILTTLFKLLFKAFDFSLSRIVFEFEAIEGIVGSIGSIIIYIAILFLIIFGLLFTVSFLMYLKGLIVEESFSEKLKKFPKGWTLVLNIILLLLPFIFASFSDPANTLMVLILFIFGCIIQALYLYYGAPMVIKTLQ